MAHPLLALGGGMSSAASAAHFEVLNHNHNHNSHSSCSSSSSTSSWSCSSSTGGAMLAPARVRLCRLRVCGFLDDVDDLSSRRSSSSNSSSSSRLMRLVMRKEFGSTGGGVVLEKSKLDTTPIGKVKVEPKLQDGGGPGSGGKNLRHGGGGGGGDDNNDDDSYFDDEGDEEEPEDGLFGKRLVITEIFDRQVLEAVMKEWYRTMSDLPSGFKQAFDMGLVSSSQLVRFLSINARPTFARGFYRLFPSSLPRLLADPSWYPYKIALEQVATIGYGIWWEVKHRGERIKDEWDLAACNVLTMAACNLAMVWALAPTRTYSSTFKYDFQNALQKLPNNVFDKSFKAREYDLTQRVASFFYKAGLLTAIGSALGTTSALLSRACVAIKKRRDPSVPPSSSLPLPSMQTSAWGYGALLGLSGNVRYQVVYGAEQLLQDRFSNIGFVLLCCTALRLVNIRLGDATRVALLGLEPEDAKERAKSYRRSRVPGSIKDFSISELLDHNKSPFSKRKVRRRVMAVQ